MNTLYINKNDQLGESASIGKTAEDLFEEWLKKEHRKYRPATLEEQYQHIDFVVYSDKLNKPVKLDIKGTKKKSRMDSSTNAQYIWVEFKNVRGDDGWLYGKSDYIVFHNRDKNCFHLVDRKELATLCEKICDNKTVNNPKEAVYHKYTREGRKDVLSLIYIDDILKCDHTISIKL